MALIDIAKVKGALRTMKKPLRVWSGTITAPAVIITMPELMDIKAICPVECVAIVDPTTAVFSHYNALGANGLTSQQAVVGTVGAGEFEVTSATTITIGDIPAANSIVMVFYHPAAGDEEVE